jgi:hypothetical protein
MRIVGEGMEGACTMWGTWDGMGSPCIACIATAAITYCLCSLGKDRWGPIAKTRGIPRDVPGVLFVHEYCSFCRDLVQEAICSTERLDRSAFFLRCLPSASMVFVVRPVNFSGSSLKAPLCVAFLRRAFSFLVPCEVSV